MLSDDPILNVAAIGVFGAVCLAFPWLFALLGAWLLWRMLRLASRGVRALPRAVKRLLGLRH